MWISLLVSSTLFMQQAIGSGPDGWMYEIQGGGFAIFLLWVIRQLFKEKQDRKKNPSHDQLREAIKNMATKEGLEYVKHELNELKGDIHDLQGDVSKLTTRVSVLESKER